MDTYQQLLPNFLFILLRAGIALTMLPFFGSRNFPPQFRIGIAVATAIILAPVVEFHIDRAAIPTAVVREIIFGMILGMSGRFVFYAVDMAGQTMSNSTGLSMATMLNPEMGQSSTELSSLYGIIATLLFFAVDAHHDLVLVFVKSYEWVPGTLNIAGVLAAAVSLTGKLFVIAIKVAAPVIILMLITNVLLGFISKAAPQMNVFFVGYPLYLFLGFLTMLVSLPAFAYLITGYFKSTPGEMMRVMQMIRQ